MFIINYGSRLFNLLKRVKKFFIPKTSNILLIGNGFDLALGFKTSYSDFLKFLSVKVYLLNIVDELRTSTEYRELVKSALHNDYFDKTKSDIKNNPNEDKVIQIFINAIDDIEDPKNHFFKDAESLKDKLDLSFISDFFALVLGEDLLKIIRGNPFNLNKLIIEHSVEYQKVKKSLNIKFDNKQTGNDFGHVSNDEEIFDATRDIDAFLIILNNKIKQARVKQWVDVESFIEFLATNDRKLCSKFYPKNKEINSPLLDDPSKEKEYCKGLEVFSNLFKEYLNDVLETNFVNFNDIANEDNLDILKDRFDIDSLVKHYFDNLERRSHGFISKIILDKVSHIINFNYTYTAEVIFKKRYNNDLLKNSYHINGEIDYANHHKITDQSNASNNLVFGFTYTNSDNKNILSQFEKRFLRNSKKLKQIESYVDPLISKPFNLLIYGHSCSVADGDVIGKLLKSTNLKIAVILCLNQESMDSIKANLLQILGNDRFYELLDNADKNVGKESLYFAVRDSKL